MQRLGQRWDQRSSGVEPLTVESSIDIACSTQDLWDFLVAPESAVLIGDGVVKAFRVPGAPAGVAGDQHCVVYEIDGRVTVHMAEVVEADAPNRMVIHWPTLSTTMLSVSTLTPTHAGTTYTSRIGLQVANGTSSKVEPGVLKAVAEGNVRLKACVEAGTRFSAPAD